MTTPRTTAHGPSGHTSAGRTKNILVFSPDADLARTLCLILEDRYQFTRETTVPGLVSALDRGRPDLVLIDLFTFSEDVRRVLDVVREKAAHVPLILLRGYIPLRQDVNASVESMGSVVFYKPVDVEQVSQAIEDLLKNPPPR